MYPQVLSVPYGCDLIQGELTENPHEFKIICLMQLWKSQGKNFAEIARILNQKNEPTKRDKIWSGMVVSKILKRNGI